MEHGKSGERELPWVSRGWHLAEIERLAAYLYMGEMSDEEETRFLWAHPEFDARRPYDG